MVMGPLRSFVVNNRKPKRPLAVCVVIVVLAVLLSTGSADPLLCMACGLVIALTVGLLWRVGEPPLLLMAAGLQLSQVVAFPLYASVIGVPLDALGVYARDLTSAAWIALAGIVSLVMGMWCGQLGTWSRAGWIEIETKTWSPQNALAFCLVTFMLSVPFGAIGKISEGLQQPALAASRIQWVGVFILTCVCVSQRRGFTYLTIIVLTQVITGLTGFFADFKEVIYVVLVGIFSVRSKIKLGSAVIGLALASFLITLGAFWSAVKEEYRQYVSLGTGEQVVLVPVEDRLQYILDRALNADSQLMSDGFERLVRRVAYIELLAATIYNVPKNIPFQEGAQIGAAIMHVLEPRILFPDKPPAPSDTAVATRYTGIRFDRGRNAVATSIGLGYIAELYVDFGYAGIVIGTFLFGLLAGSSVKWIFSYKQLPHVANSGLAVMLMLSCASFEESLLKQVGGFVATLIAVAGLQRFLLPNLLDRFFSMRLPTRDLSR
jgi:hypothetical protein